MIGIHGCGLLKYVNFCWNHEQFQDRVLGALDVIAMLCKLLKEGEPYKTASVIHLSFMTTMQVRWKINRT